ncbi:RAI1 like PD-XK nuclease-domain-containing protein [Protomyces lactucae-debilis]|uniref:Decapping nuclease n=1 Tax=Protomyces lactucae-debilis TaxID=2754530 RepID=A0A1Y2FS85_PROLT|nr:RAI1 like PD-XK nuclease-domain-containing protein [Protomyces lactucae-debilis]ORY86848.1 RAI1 like PD-XK nuclease-domain-containing protein [Protomyces lactucae-debilis]
MPEARFELGSLQRFAVPSLSRQPVELTSFSYDHERRLHHDDRSLAYYQPASNLPASLSTGFEQLVSRDESIDEHIDGLLSGLIHYEQRCSITQDSVGLAKSQQVDFVTWRGMLTKLLTIGFSNDAFEMNATVLDGTIYIEEHITDESRLEKKKREGDARQRLMSYWGYKYEALATLSKPYDACSRAEIESRDKVQVNTNVQYVSIVRTRLGQCSLLLGGEVDCVYDYKPVPDPDLQAASPDDIEGLRKKPQTPLKPESIVSHYVELKTTKVQQSRRDKESFERFKLLKFWAQSFLLGVPRIIVGYRDDEGYLQQEEELETLKIPGMVRQGTNAWDGNVCINLAAALLAFIKENLSGHAEGLWRIKYAGRSQPQRGAAPTLGFVEVVQVSSTGHGSILTPEFLAHRKSATLGSNGI